MPEKTLLELLTVEGKARVPRLGRKDKSVLRRLMGRVSELSARPAEGVKKALWYRHNALETGRPLIFCDPEGGWAEIVREEELECEETLARDWERKLRKEIFWGAEMGDDRVVQSWFPLPRVWQETDWGLRERRIGGLDGGAFTWIAPLEEYADSSRLRFPEILIQPDLTEQVFCLARELADGLLMVRLQDQWWWSMGMTRLLVELRGLEQCMVDMYDHPAELHRLIGFLRDGHLAKLDFLERSGLLSLNNDGTYVGSGGFGWTNELPQRDFDGSRVRTMDLWGFAESQETIGVSPRMFEEFVFAYQLPILQRFGLNCYGCCEPLDSRWHIVEKIPRLRRVSVSPWANLKGMAEKLGNRYIYSMKPNPAYLAVPSIDEEFIRRNLREALRLTEGCRVEIIMKDNHTIGGNPRNVTRWCAIAREEAERVA